MNSASATAVLLRETSTRLTTSGAASPPAAVELGLDAGRIGLHAREVRVRRGCEARTSLPATWSFGGMTASFGRVARHGAARQCRVKSPPQMIVVSRMVVVPRNGRSAAYCDFSSLHKGRAFAARSARGPQSARIAAAARAKALGRRAYDATSSSSFSRLSCRRCAGARARHWRRQRRSGHGPATASAPQWRTPWGHPDLQGTWSSDDVRGIPLQRPEEFGTRAELTDEEFAERQQGNDAQVARLREGGTAFLAERGVRSFRQTSLVVDPPNGRIPPLTASGQKRTDESKPAAGRGRARGRTAASTIAASRAASSARSCPSSTATASRSIKRRTTS